MAGNVYIPQANPLTFYQMGVPDVAGRNVTLLGKDWFSKQIIPTQQKIAYLQKWQLTDTVKLHIQADFGPLRLDLVDCKLKVIKTVNFVLKPTAVFNQLWSTYECEMQLADVPEGDYYYFLLTVGSGNNTLQAITEPQSIVLSDPYTMLYQYKSTYNNLDVLYKATGIQFNFRIESAIIEYTPGNKTTIFQDQRLNSVQLSAYPFDQFKLMIAGVAGSYGIPNWAIKKMNYIFCNDFVLIEGTQFMPASGAKFEAVRQPQYPMAGWQIDIVPASNLDSTVLDLTFDDSVSVAYNIDAGIFGTTNDLPTNNQITLLERK